MRAGLEPHRDGEDEILRELEEGRGLEMTLCYSGSLRLGTRVPTENFSISL